jgi:hypothetical protein
MNGHAAKHRIGRVGVDQTSWEVACDNPQSKEQAT